MHYTALQHDGWKEDHSHCSHAIPVKPAEQLHLPVTRSQGCPLQKHRYRQFTPYRPTSHSVTYHHKHYNTTDDVYPTNTWFYDNTPYLSRNITNFPEKNLDF